MLLKGEESWAYLVGDAALGLLSLSPLHGIGIGNKHKLKSDVEHDAVFKFRLLIWFMEWTVAGITCFRNDRTGCTLELPKGTSTGDLVMDHDLGSVEEILQMKKGLTHLKTQQVPLPFERAMQRLLRNAGSEICHFSPPNFSRLRTR